MDKNGYLQRRNIDSFPRMVMLKIIRAIPVLLDPSSHRKVSVKRYDFSLWLCKISNLAGINWFRVVSVNFF